MADELKKEDKRRAEKIEKSRKGFKHPKPPAKEAGKAKPPAKGKPARSGAIRKTGRGK